MNGSGTTRGLWENRPVISSARDLTRRQRRMLAVRTALRISLTTAGLLAFYAVVPIHAETTAEVYTRLILAIAVISIVMAWQVVAILRSDHPQVRAIEGLLVAVPVFLVAFALLYLGMADTNGNDFSQSLDRVRAMYFTVTVLSTVGFGDIVPRTDPARIVVTIQMVLDLALVALVVRVFFGAAKTGLARRGEEPD